MFGFIIAVGILATVIGSLYDGYVRKSRQRRKELSVSNFIDACIANGTLYPVSPPGYGPDGALNSSATRAANDLKIDRHEAYNLLCSELRRRGLPVSLDTSRAEAEKCAEEDCKQKELDKKTREALREWRKEHREENLRKAREAMAADVASKRVKTSHSDQYLGRYVERICERFGLDPAMPGDGGKLCEELERLLELQDARENKVHHKAGVKDTKKEAL